MKGVGTSINKEILRLSLPAVVSNITIPLLGLSDTAISGRLGSETYIAAIAVGSMMFNVIFWLFGFLRIGTTGLTAQAFGARDERKCRQLFSRSMLLSLLIGVGLILLQYPVGEVLMWLISPESGVEKFATSYFTIIVWSSPAVLANMSVMGWMLGMQNTVYPMIISMAINLLNILLSISAVFVFEMGFDGVAYGTLTANWLGLIISLLLVKSFCKGNLPLVGLSEILKAGELKRFFRVNTDIFLRSACIMAVSLSVTAFGAKLGALTLAGNAVMMQFFIFFSYFMDGFAFAGEAMTGRFAGGGDACNLNRTIRRLFLWSGLVTLIFTIIYIMWHEPIVRFISADEDVVMFVKECSIWLILIPSLSVFAFISDGIFVGLTATRTMLAVTLTSMAVFFILCVVDPINSEVNTHKFMSNDSLWLAFLTYLFLRGVLLIAVMNIAKKNFMKIHNHN